VGANKLAGQSEDEGGRLRRIWKKSDGFSEMKWSVSVKGPSCQHDRGQAMQKPISAPIVRHHSNATAHQSTNRRGPERPLLTRYTPVAAPLRQNRSRTTRGLFFFLRDGYRWSDLRWGTSLRSRPIAPSFIGNHVLSVFSFFPPKCALATSAHHPSFFFSLSSLSLSLLFFLLLRCPHLPFYARRSPSPTTPTIT
jgi:hypothetical protein